VYWLLATEPMFGDWSTNLAKVVATDADERKTFPLGSDLSEATESSQPSFQFRHL
jgi:hypothetical protein